jgi:hypothetical protein
MGMQSDVWSVTSFNDTAALRAAAAVGSTAAFTLITSNLPFNGAGAKVTVTSDGNDATTTFTVVGTNMAGEALTEVITGVNANTVTSTAYFNLVTSVTPSATSANNISVGLSGLALPKCRIRGVYFVGATSAGSVIVTSGSDSRKVLNVVSAAGSGANASNFYVPGEGIVMRATAIGDHATVDAALLVPTVTFLCG